MNSDEVINIFRETGALLEGHFCYASGRHGCRFLQASRVLQHPEHTDAMCATIAERFRGDDIELVVGPATGGIILSYATGRHLGCRAVFTEKDGEGGFELKRGFALPEGTRVLVVEDIITTGGSVKKTMAHLRDRGAEIVGVGALIDRSGGQAAFDCRFDALAEIQLESWAPEECPLCAKQQPIVEPDDMLNAG
jgi:orotate phosphoribosyltransferase